MFLKAAAIRSQKAGQFELPRIDLKARLAMRRVFGQWAKKRLAGEQDLNGESSGGAARSASN